MHLPTFCQPLEIQNDGNSNLRSIADLDMKVSTTSNLQNQKFWKTRIRGSARINNIAPKLQKRWTHKIAFKIISKMLKQPNFF